MVLSLGLARETLALGSGMSALLLKAEVWGAVADVCYGPKADTRTLFNNLIGAGDERSWHRETQCLSGLIVSLNLVAPGTGRSAGFSPLRMRST
jgi:hypothetical protein